MSAELDLSPPEVPEPTFPESLLRYGLFLGAIFQLICILAVIFPTSKGHEQMTVERQEIMRRLSPLMARPLNR
ncbi:protein MANBAL isoform X2 [Siniperca chuatsi]|uniref:protein MANBAL isoform X2 n=1 Tax=Siniperca chuatsi TaxID=119488 RepID=UPI001CE22980|nr:protein MANBAL isoform X2 [Siniperca chuatsi]